MRFGEVVMCLNSRAWVELRSGLCLSMTLGAGWRALRGEWSWVWAPWGREILGVELTSWREGLVEGASL